MLGVSNQLGKLIKDYKIVINKSTVPVGTAEKVREAIAKNCSVHFDVISNPEFLGLLNKELLKLSRLPGEGLPLTSLCVSDSAMFMIATIPGPKRIVEGEGVP